KKKGFLTVRKIVDNDNGGTAQCADFSFTVGGQSYNFDGTCSKTLELDAGSYTVTENNLPITGYDTSYDNCTFTLAPGGAATCTITNDDKPTSLTLIKHVEGGSEPASSWRLHAGDKSVLGNEAGAVVTEQAGTYALSETGDIVDYVAGDWTCTGGTLDGSNLTLALGDNATCTITNTYAPKRTVTVTKLVAETVPAAPAGTFEITLTCGEQTATGNIANGESVSLDNVPVDTECTAAETDPGSDWVVSGGGTFMVSVAGDNSVTITNTYAPKRTVTVTKLVAETVPAAPAGTFEITLTCGEQTATGNVANGESVSLDNVPVDTECTATETDPGSDWVVSGGDTFTVSVAGDNSVTITNTYAPKFNVVVQKVVVDPNSSAPADSSFTITLTCSGQEPDVMTFGLAGGGQKSTPLDIGTQCSVVESGIDPTLWSVTYSSESLTVTADSPNVLTVTNTYIYTTSANWHARLYSRLLETTTAL
ncbi:MAG: DUF5979 domain-containing protein, partial [Thiolinea sp.]